MNYSTSARVARCICLAATGMVVGCIGKGDAGALVKAPSRSGVVWEVDHPEDRKAAPTALLAFVSGSHVMVVDGDQAHAGSSPVVVTPTADGKRTLQLPDGTAAELVPIGEALELRFASGERAMLRKQAPRVEKAR